MSYLIAIVCSVLLCNGSFENGLIGWDVLGDYAFTRGYCDAHALQINGTIYSAPIRVTQGKMYRVKFMYHGNKLRSTVLLNLQAQNKWTLAQYTITPQSDNLFIGFEGRGVIDCVQVTEQ